MRPPQLAQRLLRRYCPLAMLEVVEGDVDERFYRKVETSGALLARGWYWKEVLLVCLWHGRNRDSFEQAWGPIMFNNYLKVVLRNLRKQKGYAFISISGLAVGLACALLILLYVQDALRYDQYHANKDHIYRLVKGNSANTPELWAPVLGEEVAGVAHAVRLMDGSFGTSNILVKNEEQKFFGDAALYADQAVFDMFTWPLVLGDAETALQRPFTMVVTESTARRYFGTTDVVGRFVSIQGLANSGNEREYTITGVLADVPTHTHIPFDFLLSFETVETLNDAGQWGTPLSWTNRMTKTYLLLEPNVTPEHILAQLPDFLRRHIDSDRYNMEDGALQALTDIHLRSDLRAEFQLGGNLAYLYLFSALAGFILLIACVNFMNLATARSQQRASEVGMRKVLGAFRPQLVRQFLGEAVLYSLLALGLALILLEGMRPVFNQLSGQSIGWDWATQAPLLLLFLAVALGVGLLAGSYPAFFLSAFQPITVLKAGGARGVHGTALRKGLVVFQFVISIGLMASTVLVFQQTNYLKNADLGFDEEHIVILPISTSSALNERAVVVKEQLLAHPNVTSVSASHSIPSHFLNSFNYRREGQSLDERQRFSDVSVDHDFIDMFGMDMIAGRAFSDALASDSMAFVLNASAVRQFGFASPEAAIGQSIEWLFPMGFTGPVIGVVEDFHFGSLHTAIPPIVFHISRFGSNFIAARIQPTNLDETLAHIEDVWTRFEADMPFQFSFLDTDIAAAYEAEERLAQTFGYGAGLAIFIACLGLLGLAAYTADRRRNEIGVRKVMGATVPSIIALLSREFVALVGVAFIIATPLAYFAMTRWLQNFAYQIDIGVAPFLGVGVVALSIALATVAYQALRAALMNPVRALRHE